MATPQRILHSLGNVRLVYALGPGLAANEDGSVRQHWESQASDEPWKTVFDGHDTQP